MPQATPITPTSIHVCRVRLTRLNADGTVATGPNNYYVSSKVETVVLKPDVLAGETKQLIGGCDCIVVSYRGYDKLMRFGTELHMAAWEAPVMEMLTGAAAITDSSTIPVPIGNQFPAALSCGATQPAVALEAWSDAWVGDSQAAQPWSRIRWVLPMTFWQITDFTLENDFAGPSFNGFSRANAQWGLGPYGDQLKSVGPVGGFFWDFALPTDSNGSYKTVSSTGS